MSRLKRGAILLASIGWIVPLSLAFSLANNFARLTYKIAAGYSGPLPWLNSFDVISGLFYFAMLWLAVVIGGWTLLLTKCP